MNEGFYVPPLSRAGILKSVRLFRDKLGMKDAIYFDIAFVIEVLAYHLNFFEFHILEDHEMQGAYAYYNPRNNSLNVSNSVYLSACNGDGRHRFTLAHELAHWYLHSNKAVLARNTQDTFPKYCDSEWQANTFASMLLMEPALIKNMPIEQIVERCSVSYQAATIAKNKVLN